MLNTEETTVSDKHKKAWDELKRAFHAAAAKFK